jgi:hypothetical protein
MTRAFCLPYERCAKSREPLAKVREAVEKRKRLVVDLGSIGDFCQYRVLDVGRRYLAGIFENLN